MKMRGKGFASECHKVKRGSGRQGYTTFETVACFFVIALVVGFAALRGKIIQDSALTVKAQADLKVMAVVIQFYKRDHAGACPKNLGNDFAREKAKWLDEVPKDFFNNRNDYGYLTSSHGHYMVWSPGPKGDGRVVSFDQGKGVQVSGEIICVTDFIPGRDAGCVVL